MHAFIDILKALRWKCSHLIQNSQNTSGNNRSKDVNVNSNAEEVYTKHPPPPPVTMLNTQDLKSSVPWTEITTKDFQRQNPIISGMSSQQPWAGSCQLLYVIGHVCLIRNHFNSQSKQYYKIVDIRYQNKWTNQIC